MIDLGAKEFADFVWADEEYQFIDKVVDKWKDSIIVALERLENTKHAINIDETKDPIEITGNKISMTLVSSKFRKIYQMDIEYNDKVDLVIEPGSYLSVMPSNNISDVESFLNLIDQHETVNYKDQFIKELDFTG